MRLYQNDIFRDRDTFFRLYKGPDIFTKMHDHDYYEIFIVVDGMITHHVNHTSEQISQYESVFVRKDDYHVLSGDDTCEVLNIAFSSSLFTHITELFGAFPASHKVRLDRDIIHYYLKKIRTLTSCPDDQRSEIALKSILVSLIQEFLSEDAVPDNPGPEWFRSFLAELTHVDIFTGDMETIYSLAAKSPEHISRTFQKYMGTTLTAYLLDLKTSYASRLLTTTSLSILEVCYESGFHNLGYFYRCFKKRFGLSPQKYRDLHTVKI